MMALFRAIGVGVFVLFLASAGCQSAYYAVWEKLGKEKRHLLKDQVEGVRSDQEKATEQFRDALTRIKELYGFGGGDLEKLYDRLRSDYERCENRAEAVRNRIDKVERIAEDLFSEWEGEIGEIGNRTLREKSARSLRAAKQRYARLHAAMVRAEASMEPVLKRLRDYVLFLKHNLNARAVGALKREAGDVELEVQRLIRDMNRSIREAEAFSKTLE